MDISSPLPCPNTATVRRNPHRRARATPTNASEIYNSSISKLREIPPVPNEEILSTQTQENASLKLSSMSLGKSDSVNIKVFLRIRPFLSFKGTGKVGSVVDQNPRLRAKNVWPQNPTKKNIVGRDKIANKKSSRVCIRVNDSHSVTLSTPIDMQESKKIKSETYGGFSYVFSSDSSQFEVYEKMLKPMVDDFLRGKNGLLAALGPSGSGKTHTVFGCPREPGMVPLALQHIFKETEPRGNLTLRSFYISIFEIYSERGKAEKLFDLLPDGCELSMQQSTVKGLREVLISNAGHAESLIAQAVLKRATAMTNTNSQSSRSQCIINIRDVHKKCEGEVSAQSNGAVLTIIDLAGAERVKKTSNQGTRLLESNFINNTLMVFGLCLRSLLEHQKNPRKPLQKHFQNSMLTRYLRDYLEGKKRMTLILTAKSGEEDYLDTSYLLRQASPYMRIKYNEAEQSNIVPNKRQYQASSTAEHEKPPSTIVHAKRMRLISSEDSVQNEEESVEERHISKEEASGVRKLDANSCVPLKLECDGQARRDRSHIIMQNFAKTLWNILKQYNAKLKVAEMEIQNLRESVGYEKKKCQELETEMNEFKASCNCCKGREVEINHECQLKLDARESGVDETNLDLLSSSLKAPESISAEESRDLAQPQSQEIVFQEMFDAKASSEPRYNHLDEKPILGTSRTLLDAEKSDREVRVRSPKPGNCTALEVEMEGNILTEFNNSSSLPDDVTLKPSSPKDVPFTKACDRVDNRLDETRINNASNPQRPKRRLMPSSSILLRDLSTLDLADETEKSKGSRGTNKSAANDLKRTDGSISLLRLLKSNLHL